MKEMVLLGLLVSWHVVREDLVPAENHLKHLAHERADRRDVLRSDSAANSDHGVDEHVKLSSDELGAFVAAGEAPELALDDLVDLLLHLTLVGGVHRPFSEGAPFLAGVSPAVGPEGRHFIGVSSHGLIETG